MMNVLYFYIVLFLVYRRAEFFKIEYPLKIDVIKAKFKGIKDHYRNPTDKNNLMKKIKLTCSFEHKEEKDGNYLIGLDLEYQISPRKGVPFQKTRDLYALIFFPKSNLLVVLGRDSAISEIIPMISKILYPDAKKINVFKHVNFDTDSIVNAIRILRNDDENSWCHDYRGKHSGTKYQGKKTTSDFSLGEGNCVLDDAEAIDAISVSTSINPTYKFYRCPKLNSKSYDSPKTISFNGEYGRISISTSPNFEIWYVFISKFLINELKW